MFTLRGFRGRGKNVVWQFLGIFETFGQGKTAEFASAMVVVGFPEGAGDVAADDGLDREHLQIFHVGAIKVVWISAAQDGIFRLDSVNDVGIRYDATGFSKPEGR